MADNNHYKQRFEIPPEVEAMVDRMFPVCVRWNDPVALAEEITTLRAQLATVTAERDARTEERDALRAVIAALGVTGDDAEHEADGEMEIALMRAGLTDEAGGLFTPLGRRALGVE